MKGTGLLNNNIDWSNLSMRDRAAYIRKAVARGLSTVDDIRLDYHLFGGGGNTNEEEPIYKVLPKLLLEAGLNIRIASGYRPAGKVGTAGKKSWHWRHGAVDIVPLGNTTFEDIENVVYNNPVIKQYLLSHNFGLLDESGRSEESRLTMKKTGATGPHFHFGRDSGPAARYRLRAGALLGGDRGKVVYFTNPDLPLEDPALKTLASREELVIPQLKASPEEILAQVSVPEPINVLQEDDNDIAANVELPEVEVIGQQRTPNPLEILSLIQESAPEQLVLQPYLIPSITNKVKELDSQRNTLLQLDLEDLILAEERRRRLGYSFRDSSIEDDIRLALFLRNISANGGPIVRMFLNGGPEINWPALGTVTFGVYPNDNFVADIANNRGFISTFTPNQTSQLWGMPADDYEANRIPYPSGILINPKFGENSIIYNPKYANRDAISLDALHIMHDNQIYLELFSDYVKEAKGTDAIYNTAKDEFGNYGVDVLNKYYSGEPLTKDEQEIITPIFDGFLRRQLAPSYMLGIKGGYDAPVDLSNTALGTKIEGIRDYLESYPLSEVTVTGRKKLFGGGGLVPIINIPTALKNMYDATKRRLYRTITPQGYNITRAAKEFIKGKDRDFSKFSPAENEVWARYLGVPYEGESSFEKAIYTPTKGGATYNDVIKFKDESQILSDDVLRQLLDNQKKTGKNTMLVKGNESGLGTYTLSLGEDKNGKYLAYYDDWDINLTRGRSAKYKIPLIELLGDIVPGSNPFTVYGRRYYTDEDLKRIIKK